MSFRIGANLFGAQEDTSIIRDIIALLGTLVPFRCCSCSFSTSFGTLGCRSGALS